MPDTPPTFYLTTPIYYVNARPHIGHAYSTIVADVLARRHRLLGDDTYFLTGTDEHGQKIERAAAAAGIPPQQYADQVSKTFSDLWARMGITHDQFIRTTGDGHKQGVQKLFADLYANGQIYLDSYTGQYSIGEEMFVEGPPGTIGPDGRPTETVTEENFFFRLNKFQLALLDLIEGDELRITPESSKNEVLSFLRGDVGDAISQIVPEQSKSQSSIDLAEVAKLRGIEWKTLLEHALDSVRSTRQPYYFDPMSVSERRSLHILALQFNDVYTKSRWKGSERAVTLYPKAFADSPARGTEATSKPEIAYTLLGNPYVPGALRDLSVSRSSFTWGIPVPEPAAFETKQRHVIYVWLDALANYMTALGYGSPDDTLWQKFWPADIHLVGKEITRFHCVYWPAFLLAAGLPLPKQVTANGWLLFDNSKMSKSKGNVVRTETILDAFGTLCPPPNIKNNNAVISTEAKRSGETPVFGSPQPPPQSTDRRGTASAVPLDPTGNAALAAEVRLASPQDRDLFAADILRYYLLREIPFGQDGSFSFDSLITRYTAELTNGYGNWVSRTLNMIQKYFSGVIQDSDVLRADIQTRTLLGSLIGDKDDAGIGYLIHIPSEAQALVRVFDHDFPRFAFPSALEALSIFMSLVDSDLTANAPWKPDPSLSDLQVATFRTKVLTQAAESIRIVTALLYPILPYATARVWAQLGLGDIEQAAADGDLRNLKWGDLKPGTKLGPLSPIFPRADKGLAQLMTDMENPPATSNQQPTTQSPHPDAPLKSALTPASPAPIPASTFDPAAPPRTSSLADPTGPLSVGGSTAHTTHNGPTPSHTEAHSSGIFAQPPPPTTNNQEPTTITIDDFAKIELRVAQITLAERIPKADKLLRLEVDLGELGHRQILSGIAEWYTPEELTGRKIVVITNLAPRKMRGLESHGMLLAASEEGGKPILATFAESVPNGTRLK